MKSIPFIACTAFIALTLTAFTYSNWNGRSTNNLKCQTAHEIEPPTFFYDLAPYAKNTITKERMHNAKTISDLIPDYRMQENLKNNSIALREVKIRIEEETVQHSRPGAEKGNANSLSKEQINLLKSTDYSTCFYLEGFSTQNNLISDSNNERYFNYYMTVVPEHQASYKAGNKAFIEFLTTNCQPTIAKVQRGNLKSGKISFTVTKDGILSKIEMNSTCGYPGVDERMMDLMLKLPDVWYAATNGKGEKVNQTLVFSYGQIGC